MAQAPYDVIGIGNASVDALVHADRLGEVFSHEIRALPGEKFGEKFEEKHK